MKVAVVGYEVSWKRKFDEERARIVSALGVVAVAVHHIGSTSIPGIVAKPVIDVLLEVNSLPALDERSDAMKRLGYENLGEFGIAGRRYFRRTARSGKRTHHVHAFQAGSPDVARHLAFRDYLIGNPAIALEYSALKKRLADEHADDAEAYIDGKSPFIQQAERDALAWVNASQPRARGH